MSWMRRLWKTDVVETSTWKKMSWYLDVVA